MIQVTNLNKSYGHQELLQDANFIIHKGERVGLLGRNGYGKTTLFRILIGRENLDSGAIDIPKKYSIAALDQHIHFTEESVLKEGCLGLSEAHKYDNWRVEKILSGLGFSENDMGRHPSLFSGGYQLRLNLAKIIVSDPDLLLLDEPTNYLDLVSIRWLIKFLQGWKKEMLLITHDRSFMDKVITHIMIIHRKKIRKIEGNTFKLYSQIAQEEEIYEKTRLNDEKKTKETEVFIQRFRAKARLAGMVQSRVKALAKKGTKEKLDHIKSLDISFNSAPFAAQSMMDVKEISFSYNKKNPFLIQKFSITIRKTDKIGVIGKNGKGKSTLLKLLAGELIPDSGEIKRHPVLKYGYFAQTNKIAMDPEKTVVEEIQMTDSTCTPQLARNVSGGLMFEGDLALKKISVLSGGEKSRVLLGKILVTPCHMALLDEPTNHLDMESCDSLIAAMDSFEGALVFVTHNELYLEALANRLIIFEGNRISLFEGGYQEFLDRVGWESDEQQGRSEKQKASKVSLDKKKLRKLKAKINDEKSKILKPLKNQLTKLEKTIEKLENDLTLNNDFILDASTQGKGGKIAELSKQSHQLKNQIDAFYEKLEEVHEVYENKLKEFEKKIDEVGEI